MSRRYTLSMEEFKGELKSIAANKIITKEKISDYDNFFLVLGLIFNDLKDLIFLSDLFNKTYKNPVLDGSEPPSAHLGQWGGVQNHFNRLMVGTMSEFIIFLQKNDKIINSFKFKLFVKKLPGQTKKDWDEILDIIKGSESKDFLSKIARIRSNVTFHYDQSLEELRSGFIRKFIDSPKNIYNEKAFYSFGDDIWDTRIYYCDGAAEEYYKKHMNYDSDINYEKDLRDLIKKTNDTLRLMMEIYIKQKT